MFSERLVNKLGLLTPKQQRAIPRMVRALADGHTMESLLKGPDKVCSWGTWYKKPNGWSHQALFMQVLEEAQGEYNKALLERAVDEAAEILRKTTPLAARLGEGIIRGVLLGREVEDLPPVLRSLYEVAMGHPVEAVIMVEDQPTTVQLPAPVSDRRQAARDLLSLGARAAEDLLNRADVKTAIKLAGGEETWRELMNQLQGTGTPRRGMAPEDGDDADLADV
jgi:hypothetical protein